MAVPVRPRLRVLKEKFAMDFSFFCIGGGLCVVSWHGATSPTADVIGINTCKLGKWPITSAVASGMSANSKAQQKPRCSLYGGCANNNELSARQSLRYMVFARAGD